MSRLPNIAIAGLAIETSTFHPGRTHASAFHACTDTQSITAYHAAVIGPGTALATQAHWHGALIGHALPGGIVTREAFDTLTTQLVANLTAIVAACGDSGDGGALDGLWLDIHGAMCVEGVTDAESVLLAQVRAVVGPGCVISASMDLHGNVSRALVHGCDLLTCYRTAPHVDVVETRRRACENLLEVLSHPRGERPYKAWIPIPVLLPGEQTSTRDAPADGIYAAVPEVAGGDGVLDAGVWVGYAWADEERNRAAVVVTGWDAAAVAAGAERLARLFWSRRYEFDFVAITGTLDECLEAAIESEMDGTPFFISDSGDNPTAGGSGDVTWTLTRLLESVDFKNENGRTLIYASLPGPEAVEVAVKAGVEAMVTVTAGAEVDNLHAGPVTMTGRVKSIKYGDKDAEVEVVMQVGGVYVILTKLRKPYHKEKDFLSLGLRPREADVVVVKIGYLEPELYAMAEGWMLALTPGGVDQDLYRLGYQRVRRPIWPIDVGRGRWEDKVDLKARMVAMSDERLEGVDE